MRPHRRRGRGVGALALAVTALLPRIAAPLPPQNKPNETAGQAPATAAQRGTAPASGDKEAARLHFDRAVRLQGEGAWDPALAEYRESLSLYPTRAATKNAAICLQLLLRYDEALEMFARLRDLPNLPDNDRALAIQSIARLEGLLGSIEIVDGPAGARVIVDGKERGRLPLSAPLRVPAGSHLVQVRKDGFFPVERRVDVAGGAVKRVGVELPPLTAFGQLKVVEARGKKLQVVVDNLVVGDTPWSGMLDVGAHAVWLKGEGRMGSAPTPAWVKRDKDTVLTLSAVELPGWLRVEPTPVGAAVLIDSVEVSHGAWEGWLPAGPHRVDVIAEGFSYETRTAVLEKDGRQVLVVRLERGNGPSEPDSSEPASAPSWAERLRVAAKFGFASALFAGDLAGAPCRNAECNTSRLLGVTFGLDAGYEVAPGVSVGVAAGGLWMSADRAERGFDLLAPLNRPYYGDPMYDAPGVRNPGAMTDDLTLSGALVGASLAVRREGKVIVGGRLGAGALIGAMTDSRAGIFTDSKRLRFATGPTTQAAGLGYAYLNPELWVGVRPTDRFEVGVGLGALFLLAVAQPRWSGKREVFAGNDGVGHYHEDALLRPSFAVITPALGASYRF